MSVTITNLRSSSNILTPHVVQKSCTASAGLTILCSISNSPVSVGKSTIRNSYKIRASVDVLCIQIVVIRGVDPDKLSNFINCSCQCAVKSAMVNPYLS